MMNWFTIIILSSEREILALTGRETQYFTLLPVNQNPLRTGYPQRVAIIASHPEDTRICKMFYSWNTETLPNQCFYSPCHANLNPTADRQSAAQSYHSLYRLSRKCCIVWYMSCSRKAVRWGTGGQRFLGCIFRTHLPAGRGPARAAVKCVLKMLWINSGHGDCRFYLWRSPVTFRNVIMSR
jgi:hypothetical protein